MKFRLEELGDLQRVADREAGLFAEASHREMGAQGDDVKKAVRDDLKRSGVKGAARLAGAWRGKLFPRSPKAHAARPAYVLGNNAGKILDTLEEGGTIRAKGGGLLVPIGPARRIKLSPGQPKSALPELALKMYGATRFVSQRLKRTRELALGVFTAADGGRRRFVPLFLLKKAVDMPKLLKGGEIIEERAHGLSERHAQGTWARFSRAVEAEGRSSADTVRRVTQAG